MQSVRLVQLGHGPFGLGHGLVKLKGEAGSGLAETGDLDRVWGSGRGLELGWTDGWIWGRLERLGRGTYGKRRVGAGAGPTPPLEGMGRTIRVQSLLGDGSLREGAWEPVGSVPRIGGCPADPVRRFSPPAPMSPAASAAAPASLKVTTSPRPGSRLALEVAVPAAAASPATTPPWRNSAAASSCPGSARARCPGRCCCSRSAPCGCAPRPWRS
jgi:hypothetical protein